MSLLKKIFDLFAGRKILQPFFEVLYTAGVYGMNYGSGDVRNSGETKAVEYIRKRLNQRDGTLVLFDVGANLGKYTLRLEKAFAGTSFRIYSFEPSAIIFRELEKNTTGHNAQCFCVGLGDETGQRVLYKRTDYSGHGSVYHRRLEHHNLSLDIREEIRMTTIDQFCTDHQIEHIHLLKIDVEGHELSCLRGAARMLRERRINFIQFEFGGCNIDSRTFFQDFWYLLNEQFHFYRIVKDGLIPIQAYNERLELFKNINFLLEQKSDSVKE